MFRTRHLVAAIAALAVMGGVGVGRASAAPVPPPAAAPVFGPDAPLEDLLADPRSRAILQQVAPEILANPNAHEYAGMTLGVVAAMFRGRLTSDQLAQLEARIGALAPPIPLEPGPTRRARLEALYIGVSPAALDPARLLPPPPADRSPEHLAELAQLRRIQAERTPERLAQAKSDDYHDDPTPFLTVLGPTADLKGLPATRRLLDVVLTDQWVASTVAKDIFLRHHPWIFDASLVGCDRGKSADPLSSYPSGHAALGFALATVLAGLAPQKATPLLARADSYAQSRMVCEVHYPTDIVAAQVLGTALGLQILQSPALQAQLADARAELKAAGLAGAP